MDKFLRISDVSEKTGLGKSTIWLWIKENKFPKPTKLSSRVTVWKNSDLEEWISSRNNYDA
ncbi:MAG: helix-turn-helix transcriptional regulator [Candidatus Paceibacteria bacterium]